MDSDQIAPRGGIDFGRVAGRAARLYTIESDQLRARITDYGGILVSVEAPAAGGGHDHVLLGFDDAADYAANRGSFGALLGRNANRIAGGSVTIDGQTFSLSKNENGSTLHGGSVGFGKQFWSVVSATREGIALRLVSPDGDQGFPGEVEVTATYRLAGPALHLVFDAQTTKPTPLSLSAHPYFNLDGVGARDILDHRRGQRRIEPHEVTLHVGQPERRQPDAIEHALVVRAEPIGEQPRKGDDDGEDTDADRERARRP